jgi:hypothetical protein
MSQARQNPKRMTSRVLGVARRRARPGGCGRRAVAVRPAERIRAHPRDPR